MRLKLFVWTWYGFWLYQIYVITDFYIAICWYETFNYGYWSWQYFPANTHMRCCEFLQQTRATFPPAVSLLSATCKTQFSFLSVFWCSWVLWTSSKPRSSGEWRKRAGGCDSWFRSIWHSTQAEGKLGCWEENGHWPLWTLREVWP